VSPLAAGAEHSMSTPIYSVVTPAGKSKKSFTVT
jgi:hypothetical protein